jgi:hypothetical protein
MPTLPEIRRPPLSVAERAHLAEVQRIAAEGRTNRALQARASAVQRERDTEKRARAEAWAENWSRQLAAAQREGERTARASWPQAMTEALT